MKLKYKFTSMKEITMLEFRRDTRRALAAIGRGERLLLTYRGRPIARLEPVRASRSTPVEDDPLLRLEQYAVDGPGGVFTNAQIDRVLYGP